MKARQVNAAVYITCCPLGSEPCCLSALRVSSVAPRAVRHGVDISSQTSSKALR